MKCLVCNSDIRNDAVYCVHCGAHQENVRERDDYLYSAFISYRHNPHDTEVATKLQQAIEAYRLPKDIATSYGSSKLDHCFRDSSELPTTSSLPDSIAEALARSRALIVVCSPNTPQSRWVQREIELFASLHGRKNIHLVLAEGASSESIPPLLYKRLVPQPDGSIAEVPAEPLAADMRPSAAKQFDTEKLRIIAALAGCAYDDLARRDRVRQRKQVRIVAAFVLIAALLIGGFAYHQLQATAAADRAAQVAQAQHLATQAQQLYAQGDRYGAIKTALQANDKLPATGAEDTTTAVHDTLLDALQLQPSESNLWLPSYIISLDAPIATSVLSEPGGWFAILDTNHTISVFRTSTGQQLATITFPPEVATQFDDKTRIMLRDGGKYLVIATNASDGYTASYDPYTGKCEWSFDVPEDSAATFYNDDFTVAQFAAYDDSTLLVWAVDVGLAGTIGQQLIENAPLPASYVVQDSVSGEGAWSYFLGLDDSLINIDIETGEVKVAHAAYRKLHSMEYFYGAVFVSTSDLTSNEPHAYAVEAFDNSLNPLWRFDGTSRTTVVDDQGGFGFIEGSPTIHGFIAEGVPCAAVSAGRDFYLLSVADGSVVYSRTFDAPIVGVYIWPTGRDADALIIARSNGLATIVDPLEANMGYEGLVTDLNFQRDIRFARTAITDKRCFVTIAFPTSDTSTVVAYHSNFNPNDAAPRNYTLDELVQLAHEMLREDGYE